MDGHTLESEKILKARGAKHMCNSIKREFEEHPHSNITNKYIIKMCDLLVEGLEERYGV